MSKFTISDDFRGNKSQLICLNLLYNIGKIWRPSLKAADRWREMD